MIVVDASVLIEVLRQSEAAHAIEEHLFARAETLHAPHLLDLEVARVLRRYVQRGDMSPRRRGAEALDDLRGFRLTRYEHEAFLNGIWELRDRCTVYDAAYLALAETLDATLLTRDRALAAAAREDVRVEVV